MLKKIMDKIFVMKQKAELEKQLAQFEDQINLTKKFPEYGTAEDDNIQEVERFAENLNLQKSLKNLIKDTKDALKRIEKDKYGICSACSNEIETGRLKVYPSAEQCASCASKRRRK